MSSPDVPDMPDHEDASIATPRRSVADTLDVTAEEVSRAAAIGGAAYVISWVAAALGGALTLVASALDDGGLPWSVVVTAPGQIVAMAFGSPLSTTIGLDDADLGGSESLVIQYGFVPIVISVVALVSAAWLSRREQRRTAPRSVTSTITLAVATASAFTTLAFLVAFVFRVSLDTDMVDGSAAHVELVVWGLVAIASAAVVGRRPSIRSTVRTRLPAEAGDAVRAVGVHVATFLVLALLVFVGWLAVEGELAAVLVIPVAIGNLAVAAIAFGHLGAYDVGFAGEGGGLVWLFSDGVPRTAYAGIAFAVIAALVAGAVLHARSGGAARSRRAALWTVGMYAAAGLVVIVLGSFTFGTDGIGSGSFGPAWWLVPVMGAWGGLAEVTARTIASPLTRVLPGGVLARAAGPLESRGVSTPADEQPLSPAARRLLVLVGIGSALLVAVFVAVGVLNSTRFGPEPEALAFVKDSAAGRADVPRGIDDEDVDEALLAPAITKTLGGSVADARVTEVDVYGTSAEATVEYRLGGDDVTQTIELAKKGSRFGVFDRWEVVDGGLTQIYLTAPEATSLTVNGIRVDVEGLADGVSLLALPGSYDIVPDAGTKFLTFDPQTVTASDEDYTDATFKVKPSETLVAQVSMSANAFLNDCIARDEAEPEGCPNITYGTDLEGVEWTLVQEPSYVVESDYDGGWTFSTETPGRATVTATEPPFFDGDTSTPYEDSTDIDISGTIELDAGAVEVEVDDTFF